jgi:hypothetical protein
MLSPLFLERCSLALQRIKRIMSSSQLSVFMVYYTGQMRSSLSCCRRETAMDARIILLVYKMLTFEPKTGKIIGDEWFLSSPKPMADKNQLGEEH